MSQTVPSNQHCMNAMKPHSLFRVLFWIGVFALWGMTSGKAASAVRSVDLKPFLGKSQFQTINADWILPRGRQVVEGVPFQVDGVVEVAGTSARFSNVGRTNVNDIPIGGAYERFYLLGAASRDVNEGVLVARLRLKFDDGSETDLPIEYGRHVMDWMSARHKGEAALSEPDSRVAWQVEHPAAARRDDSLRLYFTSVENPEPARKVRSISIISGRARGGFMLAALTAGPARIEPGDRPPDTLARVEEHFHVEGAPGGKPALSGRVFDEQGRGVTNAVVRVISVKTVDTSDALTPADSEIVGREVSTDSSGRWRMPELSERLLYRLLVAAPSTQAAMFDGADPLAGPANVQVRSGSSGETGQHLVHARLLGLDGKPVVGASVKPDGVGVGGSTSWGGNNGFPNEVVTGLNGEFIMAREQPFTRMSVNIKANDLAPAKVWLPVSNGVHQIQLGPGAILTGRVLKGKMPMADIEVGVSGANRNSEVFAGHYEIRTDADGRFRFEHLPPNTDWFFYGLMKSLRRDGSLAPRPARSAGHGASTDLGDLEVQPSVTLAGEVRTAKGDPVPSNLRVTASYDAAWDSQAARVDRSGKFELTGLHPGLMEIYISATSGSSQWVPTAHNHSLDEWNSRSLAGILKEDKRDLIIMIEKRSNTFNSYSGDNGYLPELDRARNLPLAGAEATGPAPILLAGTVVDDVTGAPISKVRITPGRKPPSTTPNLGGGLVGAIVEALRPQPVPWNERPWWDRNRTLEYADGRFSVSFRPMTSLPMLRVEAEGYHVLDTVPRSSSESNLVLRLKKGSGPKGVLLGTNGLPVEGAVVLFGGENEQFSFNTDGTLSSYGSERSRTVTSADGSFTFPAKANGRRVFAANESGWASVWVKNWPADGRVRLQPWAEATGTLIEGGKPVANVQVAIESERTYEEGDSFVNFQERPMTDAAGRFAFKWIPPGPIRLMYLVPMNSGGWMHAPQTNFTALPGGKIDLGTMTKVPNRF